MSTASAIGNSEDETACKQINDLFIDNGRFCNPETANPGAP